MDNKKAPEWEREQGDVLQETLGWISSYFNGSFTGDSSRYLEIDGMVYVVTVKEFVLESEQIKQWAEMVGIKL